MKLLIATHNQAKLKEIKKNMEKLLSHPIEIISLHDTGIKQSPQETGKTIEENAIIKAHYYAEKTNLPVLSDDSGFHIDALNGEPGVLSNQWLGREASDQELIDYTMKRMHGIPKQKRTATLDTVLCLYHPHKNETICEYGSVRGYIPDVPYPTFEEGFPFRPVFVIAQYNKYYDELTEEEHEKVNQRLIAMRKIVPQIEKILVK